VKLRCELPQRNIELRREHKHRQPSLKAEAALGQPDADRNRHERDAERRRQLQHRS
jgi:hypothetical protein